MSEHKLQVDAMGRKPMTTVDVFSIMQTSGLMTRDKLIEIVGKLCLSHERLRMELEGYEILNEIAAMKIGRSWTLGKSRVNCPRGLWCM